MAITNQAMQNIRAILCQTQIIMEPINYVDRSYKVYSYPDGSMGMSFDINYAYTSIPNPWMNFFKQQISIVDINFTGNDFTFDKNHAIIKLSPNPDIPDVTYINQFRVMLDKATQEYYNYLEAILIAKQEADDANAAALDENQARSESFITPDDVKGQRKAIESLPQVAMPGWVPTNTPEPTTPMPNPTEYGHYDVNPQPNPFRYNYGRNN